MLQQVSDGVKFMQYTGRDELFREVSVANWELRNCGDGW